MRKIKPTLLTLSDINVITNSAIGNIYLDMYEEVYGTQADDGILFTSTEEFDVDFRVLSKLIDKKIDEEANFFRV
jgi:hypothetical protein